jgi:hypothetical protein
MRRSAGIKRPLVTSLGVIALPIHAVWPGPDPPHPARVSPGSSRKEQPRARYREIVQLRMPAMSRSRAAGSRARRSTVQARLVTHPPQHDPALLLDYLVDRMLTAKNYPEFLENYC